MTELSTRSSAPAGEQRWPATFAELNGAAGTENGCARCHDLPATHTVIITVSKMGAGKGGMVATRRARFCEACAVRVYGPVARALR